MNLFIWGVGSALVGLSLISTADAEEVNPIPTVTDGFRLILTPYLWTPGISGSVDYNHNVQRVHTHISTEPLVNGK